MSLEITAKIICDNCRAEIVGPIVRKSTRQAKSYWDAKRTAEANGWLIVSRGRYRTQAHYCRDCADKPVVKIKDPPRKQKCRCCLGRGTVMKWNDGVGKAELCPECGGSGKPKTHNISS